MAQRRKKTNTLTRTISPFTHRNQPLLVLTTAGSPSEARRLARLLLKHKLAGCINLIPHIHSLYWWRGKVAHGKEILLFIKTSAFRLNQLARFLKLHHSYEVPELIAIPISWGDEVYLEWLKQSMEIS